jgi:hypothetical protein
VWVTEGGCGVAPITTVSCPSLTFTVDVSASILNYSLTGIKKLLLNPNLKLSKPIFGSNMAFMGLFWGDFHNF